MWMDDVEMARDAYRVWLGTKFACEYDSEGCEARPVTVLREALEAFDIIFGGESLEEKVLAVAERIDADPEEIEQDIKDAVKAVRGEGKMNRAIGYNVCLDCGNRGWFELYTGGNKCTECGSLNTEDWTKQYTM